MTKAKEEGRRRSDKKGKKKKRERGNPFLREKYCVYCHTPIPLAKKERWCDKCVKYLDKNPVARAIDKMRENPFSIV